MTVAEEIALLNDCFIVSLDVKDSPSAELPLAELYDMVTSSLRDNYRDTIRETVIQILEDTMWINANMMEAFINATFGIFDVREGGLIVSLRTAGLQRLTMQAVAHRTLPIVAIQIPLLIRFKSPDQALPTPRTIPTIMDTTVEHPFSRPGPPSNVSETEFLDQVSELPASSPVPQQARGGASGIFPAPGATTNPATVPDTAQDNVSATYLPSASSTRAEPGPVPGTRNADRDERHPEPDTMDARYRAHPGSMASNVGPNFRGTPIIMETLNTTSSAPGSDLRDNYDSYGGHPTGTNNASSRRARLFDHTAERTPSLRTPTRSHPFNNEVSFGAETFQDYMSQFQVSEVKYKDFRKVTIPKFDASKNDSFVHWYKFLVSTCLQWGVWCPPYESVEEDNVHGCWWMMLPQSVRDQQSFMGHLLYSLLIKPDTFPSNSRELEAVEGSTANAGYNAIYNILRLHHPILHSVYSTANEIPRHRRSETFSLYLRRLQEFIARERLAMRTYTESEALDLAVRNLSTEWRNEFRRLVERDKSAGKGGSLPFKLALPQIATTFVEYADKIGRDAPGSRPSPASLRAPPTAIMRRLETTTEMDDAESMHLPEADVDLIVNAIAQNQQSSTTCLGCGQTGHTLTDCNRFVDYIVAESLAQRHPALLDDNDDDDLTTGYRQHSIHVSNDDPTGDFEACFSDFSIQSVHILGVDNDYPVSAETVVIEPTPTCDPVVVRRLAETYDPDTATVYAHADNGSMACTVNDSKLLFAYRLLGKSSIRLFDAGDHVHRPLGVGFLCVPTDNRGIGGAPQFVFVRTYHTPTIPGVIISHSAISTQLRTSGYYMSSHSDIAGFIHFPHRLRHSQDVFIPIQPISRRGGLTFTEALILPTHEQHIAPIPPWPTAVRRLCSDHSPDPAAPDVLDPTDGMTCPLSGSPSDNNGPRPHGCGAIAENESIVLSSPQESQANQDPTSTTPDPMIHSDDDTVHSSVSESVSYLVRSLSRSALRMLWHQRLGHLNFRRLSTMHRFVKGMPEFTLPTALEECPVCLAAKLRKQPSGTATIMRSTVCNQGISIDFGFMVQKNHDKSRQHNLIGLNGETCYALITDHFSGRLYGRAFTSKAPPIDWVNNWLANNAPSCPDKYVRMDGGGELGKSRDILRIFADFGYTVELTGPDSSNQNGPGERPHQTIADALRAMLSGASLQPSFWPYAFYHYVRLYNFVPHGSRPSSPHEMCGSELPNLSKLRTFGCRVHVRPTTVRYGKLVPNSRLGIFLGYSRSLKIMYYYDIDSAVVKTATHARFDEGMNDVLGTPPPNVQILRQMNSDNPVIPDLVDLSPLDLSVSDDPFDRLDKLTPAIVCDHPTLGFEVSECHIRKRAYVSEIIPRTSAARIKNARRKYIGSFIVSVNDTPVFTAESAILALTAAASSEESSFRIVFAPDRYIPIANRRESPVHLSVDQLRVINTILSSPDRTHLTRQ
ncbi:Reverse transcriptase (RNA-dependent DNA polymerase) [Fragilaria crotonensis]|nr:Reverse transcriptase (RNA-dependent DNA polymerase) [Fragilaria crotonensis]